MGEQTTTEERSSAAWAWLLAVILVSGCATHTLVLSNAASSADPIRRSVSSTLDVRSECPGGVARIDVNQNAVLKVVTLGLKDTISVRVWCAASPQGTPPSTAASPRSIIIVPGS